MPHYCVSYDLRAPGRNYQPLYDAFAQARAVRALQSLWLVTSTHTSSQLRDVLRGMMDANDGLLITEIANSNWAAYKILPSAAEWLKARFP